MALPGSRALGTPGALQTLGGGRPHEAVTQVQGLLVPQGSGTFRRHSVLFSPRPECLTAFLFLEGGGFDWNTSSVLNSYVGVVMLSCVDFSLVLLTVALWWGWLRALIQNQSRVKH